MKLNKLIGIYSILIIVVVLSLFSISSQADSSPRGNFDSCANIGEYNLTREVYIAPYMGDIDGNVAPERFQFLSNLTEFHISNNIPLGASFYPAAINTNRKFVESFALMYNSPNIELIQKGNEGSEEEMNMANLSIERQREIVEEGQRNFKEKMSDFTGAEEINLPTSYNQIHGSFDENTLQVLQSLGINQYFDVFVSDDLDPVNPTSNFSVIQYGITYTDGPGTVGSELEFKSSDMILCEIDSYERDDVEMTYIEGKPVIPLWAHQQDFQNASSPDFINHEKWEIYQETLLRLQENPNVEFLLPQQVYDRIYGPTIPELSEEYCFSPNSNDREVQVEKNGWIEMCENVDFYLPGFSVDLVKNCEDIMFYILGDLIGMENLESKINTTTTLSYNNFLFRPSIILAEGSPVYDASEVWVENSMNDNISIIELNRNDSVIEVQEDFYIDKIGLRLPEESSREIEADEVILCSERLPTIWAPENVKICSWKDCKKGAVSISADDQSTACRADLEAQGYRGTYYLSNTDQFTQSMWDEYDEMFEMGHEIGTHTRDHRCIYDTARHYRNDLNENRNDITSNTNIPYESIISHSYPCGYGTEKDMEVLEEEGYLSARGYNLNEFESQTPENFFYLKSFNEKEYPGGDLTPPDYYDVIDETHETGRWTNLVFHAWCSDDDVIDYLPGKNLWVDTVGNVAKYIYLRDNAEIQNYAFDSSTQTMSFDVVTDREFQESKYSQSLSLNIGVGSDEVEYVTVNGEEVEYEWERNPAVNKIQVDVPFPINSYVEVKLRNGS